MSIPGMKSFVALPSPAVTSRFVVISPAGVRHTGCWPTREIAFEYSASLGGDTPEIEARIQPCEPYSA